MPVISMFYGLIVSTSVNPRIVKVKPLENYELELLFSNDETRIFDIKPYLTKGIFSELTDETIFNSVKPFNGTVVWSNELDFCPDTLYIDSVKNNYKSDSKIQ